MTRPMDAIGTALERTRHVLFEPFDATKYLAIAFCAWLYRLGSLAGRSTATFDRPWDAGRGPGGPDEGWQDAWAWLTSHALMVIPLATATVALALLVGLLVLFLQSRGTFMLIDDLVRDRPGVAGPWSAYAEQAGDLFRFRLLLALVVLLVASAMAALVGLGLWATWGPPPWTALNVAIVAAGGLVAGAVGIAAAVTDAVALELVAPVVYARHCTIGQGFGEVWARFTEHVGGFLLFVLLRLAGTALLAAATGVLACFTCGLALLPFVGTLVVLPGIVFLRAFSLDFVAQLDPTLDQALHPVAGGPVAR